MGRARTYVLPDAPADGAAYRAEPGATGARKLVERFRGGASPEAFELAGYLAAVPLVLPVMRLVQRVMLPRSGACHLAEVFLSGLLTPDADRPDPHEDPELTLYAFRSGVWELLLDTLTRCESLRVLDVVSRVSGKVARRLGGSLDFRALMPASDASGEWRLPEDSLPFARIAATVLAGVGGEYRATADALPAGTRAAELAEPIAPEAAVAEAMEPETVEPEAAEEAAPPSSNSPSPRAWWVWPSTPGRSACGWSAATGAASARSVRSSSAAPTRRPTPTPRSSKSATTAGVPCTGFHPSR